jgi:hypothetical protein
MDLPNKVDQTYFTSLEEMGNCLQAAIATLLGLRLDQVPDLRPGDKNNVRYESQRSKLDRWLESFDYKHMDFEGDPIERGLYLATGWTTRAKHLKHVVVMLDGETWHDPHPTREGIAFVDSTTMVFPIYPHKALNKESIKPIVPERTQVGWMLELKADQYIWKERENVSS